MTATIRKAGRLGPQGAAIVSVWSRCGGGVRRGRCGSSWSVPTMLLSARGMSSCPVERRWPTTKFPGFAWLTRGEAEPARAWARRHTRWFWGT